MAAGALLCLVAWRTVAQVEETWDTGLTGRVSFTQASFYRWHNGGEGALALSLGLTGTAKRNGAGWQQDHRLRLAYGLVKQKDVALRKAEDVVHIALAFADAGSRAQRRLQPTAAIDIRSQMAAGFDYEADDGEAPPRISAFLAPLTLIETIGVRVRALGFLDTLVGLAGKHTVVTDRALRARYSLAADRAFRNELGISLAVTVDSELAANVHLDHKLQLFGAFNQPGTPDMIAETQIIMKVNKWLQVNMEYAARLDRDVVKSVQMRSVVSVGFAVALV